LKTTALRPHGMEAVTQAAAGEDRKPVGCPNLTEAKPHRLGQCQDEARRLSSSISSDLTSLREIIFGMNRLF
jgi:hypothetical protein